MKRPLGDRILVRRTKMEEKTTGGLIIPEVAQTELNEGTVLAVGGGRSGPDGILLELEVQPGDVVEFSKFGGVKVSISDYSADGKKEELIVLKEGEILLRGV